MDNSILEVADETINVRSEKIGNTEDAIKLEETNISKDSVIVIPTIGDITKTTSPDRPDHPYYGDLAVLAQEHSGLLVQCRDGSFLWSRLLLASWSLLLHLLLGHKGDLLSPAPRLHSIQGDGHLPCPLSQ